MLFNSVDFLIFFIIVFSVNYALRKTLKPRVLFLLLCSYFFYASWNNYLLLLILASTLIDYFAALQIEKAETPIHKKAFLYVSIILNLGVLGFFKYFNFFIESAHTFFSSIGIPFHGATLEILLPVGISFYTFQSLSYSVDVYRKTISAEKSFSKFALYISFFPQLVAGPIVRSQDFFPWLKNVYRLSKKEFILGTSLIWFGLFKKILLADFLALYSDKYFENISASTHTIVDLVLGTLCFSMQIYLDFSGYTDVALGAALLLGFTFPMNFNYPYLAKTFSEFWQRWHISLSYWFRDYVYIPLGGNRTNKTSRNVMITMLLSGLWHGAAWNFILWGAFHGVLLTFQKQLLSFSKHVLAQRIFVLICIIIGWYIFRIKQLSDMGYSLAHLQNFNIISIELGQVLALIIVLLLFIYQLKSKTLNLKQKVLNLPIPMIIFVHASIFLLITILGDYGKPFIYFQF